MELETQINYVSKLHQEQSPKILKYSKEQSLSNDYLKIPNKKKENMEGL